MCLPFKILNLFGMLSSWGSSNYRPSASFLFEVASHVKNCHFGDYYIKTLHQRKAFTYESLIQIRHSKRPITTWLTTKKGVDKDPQEVRWVRRVGYGEERVSDSVGGGTGAGLNGLVDGRKALPQVTVADQGVRQQVTARRKQNHGYH